MVILENIREKDGILECDYNPAKTGILGHIIFKNGSAVVSKYSAYEKDFKHKIYSSKALNKLKSIANSGEPIPEIAAVIWY